MVFVLVGRNNYSVTSTLADRDRVSWKYVYEQWDNASCGCWRRWYFPPCDSDGWYRFI